MPFPTDAIKPGEVLELHTHRHWHTIAWPIFVAVVLGVGLGLLWMLVLPSGLFGTILLILAAAVVIPLFVRLCIRPLAAWRATQFAFTNQRLLLRTGIFKVTNGDIHLDQINHVSSEQGLFDRIIGCGTLCLGPSASPNAHRLEHIPMVAKVQVLVNVLMQGSDHSPADAPAAQHAEASSGDVATNTGSVPAQ